MEKTSQTQYRGINYSKKKTIVLFPSSNTIETIIIIIIIIIIIWTIQICFAPAPEKSVFFFMNKDNYVCV